VNTYTETVADDSSNLTLDAILQAKESLRPVVYYGLSTEQERNVITYSTLHTPPFCIVQPDDLQMAINNTPELLWKPIKEME
jgi:hypothetical protein